MSRGRPLRTLVLMLGVVGAAYALVAPVHTQGPGNGQGLLIGLHKGRQVAAGEVLVKFREDARFTELGQDFDVDRDEQIGDGSIRRIHSRSHNVDTLLAKLADRADVEYAEPNYIVYAYETLPSDTYFSLLWGLKNTGQAINGRAGTAGADIEATLAWDLTKGNASNVVAVVDTGIDYTHPDLGTNVWSAPAAFTVNIGGSTLSCAAGTHGFNAIRKTCDPMDDHGHGTHVSGTIGALPNNGGVVGVNWFASIIGLKFLNSTGSGTTADAINAIEFAIQLKRNGIANVRVLSNSWGGGGFEQALFNKINDANTNDMLFVAAAGNAGTNNDITANYPSNYAVDNVIAVAATDNRDALASFSNYGSTTVDLGAPGVDIASTYKGGYAYMSGTSMATPHVSGVAALALGYCQPLLTTPQLKNALLANVEPIGSLSGKTLTGGRLNAYRAVSNCGGAPSQSDFSISASPSSANVKRGRSTTYTVTVAPIGGFSAGVALSAAGLPANASATFSPSTVSGAGNSGMTVTTKSSTPTGTYTLTITGTSESLKRSTAVTLKVTR